MLINQLGEMDAGFEENGPLIKAINTGVVLKEIHKIHKKLLIVDFEIINDLAKTMRRGIDLPEGIIRSIGGRSAHWDAFLLRFVPDTLGFFIIPVPGIGDGSRIGGSRPPGGLVHLAMSSQTRLGVLGARGVEVDIRGTEIR
jgi:hypothetical protein